jgi:putative chitinase
MSITAAHLIEIMPNIPRSCAADYAALLSKAMLAGGITTILRAAAFLGQLAEESGDLRHLREIADGSEYEGRKDLGNIHPGDGKRYPGRGGIQRTGYDNYLRFQQATGVPVIEHPEMLEQPENAFRSDVLYWTDHGLNAYADNLDYMGLSKIVNLGTPHTDRTPNGWIMRESKTYLALGVLSRGVTIITADVTDGVPDSLRRPA